MLFQTGQALAGLNSQGGLGVLKPDIAVRNRDRKLISGQAHSKVKFATNRNEPLYPIICDVSYAKEFAGAVPLIR